MGRLDLPERHSENLTVTRYYLDELYQEIADLRRQLTSVRGFDIIALRSTHEPKRSTLEGITQHHD